MISNLDVVMTTPFLESLYNFLYRFDDTLRILHNAFYKLSFPLYKMYTHFLMICGYNLIDIGFVHG